MNNNDQESEELVTVEKDLENSPWGTVIIVTRLICLSCLVFGSVLIFYFREQYFDSVLAYLFFFIIILITGLTELFFRIYTLHWDGTDRYRKRRYKVKSSKGDVRVSKEVPKESSMSDELKNLNQLHKDGILSDEEFKKAKEKLLS